MFDSKTRRLMTAGALAFGIFFGGSAEAQQPQPAQPDAAPRQGGGGGPAGPDSLQIGDPTGFVSIFDGTLTNWDGDPAFWRAENNTIVGESSLTNAVKQNTFLIYRAEQPRDFELKVEFKMNSTNSGVQFRSKSIPGDHQWRLSGYQADFDFVNRYTGSIYDEQGRGGFLALRGQFTRGDVGAKRRVLGQLADDASLKGIIKINDWNQLHVIARGNLITVMINGKMMSQFVDEDPENRELEGLMGLQMHVGPPMKVEFRNIYLKKL